MRLPKTISIRPATAPLRAVLTMPGSKSVTNRALLLAAIADGKSILRGALWADDTQVMVDSLRKLGFKVRVSNRRDDSNCDIEVKGLGGTIPAKKAHLFIGNAGTAARFLTAFVSTGNGEYRVDGTARMRERPMQPLFGALQSLGAEIRHIKVEGHFPIVIHARGLRGNAVKIASDDSSQFASALLMIAPLIEAGRKPFSLNLLGTPVSEPYLRMTHAMVKSFGVRASRTVSGFKVSRCDSYRARDFSVPPDASAASYFLAAAALCGGSVTIRGLSRSFSSSLQGDAAFANYLRQLGCRITELGGLQIRSAIRTKKFFPRPLNMSDVSDVALTLSVIAPFLSRPTTIRGLAHARLQETDRVAAVANELAKVGVLVDCHHDGWTIYPTQRFLPATIETYGDHRIAMAFSILGLKDVMGNGKPWLRIKNPACVRKTFPNFFKKLEELRKQ